MGAGVWTRNGGDGPVAKSVSQVKPVRGHGAVNPIRLQRLPLNDLLRPRAAKGAEPDIGRDGRVRLPQEQHIDRLWNAPSEGLISGDVGRVAVGANDVGAEGVGEVPGIGRLT